MKEVTIYYADDGKEFHDRAECLDYEESIANQLRWLKMKEEVEVRVDQFLASYLEKHKKGRNTITHMKYGIMEWVKNGIISGDSYDD